MNIVPSEADMSSSTVLVTGAASGVGKATTEAFANVGSMVWAVDIHDIELEATSMGRIVPIRGDIGSESLVSSLADQLMAQRGRVDAVVHCAGVLQMGGLVDCEIDEWNALIRTNLTSGFLLLKHMHPLLAASSRPSVVLVGSVAGIDGGNNSGPAYAAAKAGVHGLTMWAARRLAPEGIRVNAIAPGPLDTPMGRVQEFDPSRIPLGRLGQAADIAATALFLTSSSASWITGQIVSPNGGTKIG